MLKLSQVPCVYQFRHPGTGCAVILTKAARLATAVLCAHLPVGSRLRRSGSDGVVALVRRQTHVLVIDAEGFLRDGLCALLQQEGSLQLDGAFGNARSAIRTRGNLQPHVVVTDFSVAMKTGPQTILHLKRRWPRGAPRHDSGLWRGRRRASN